VYLATTKTYLGWAKGLSWKKEEASSTKVLLATTSMCTYNVKIKECQITHIELFILVFLEACDLSKGHLQDTSKLHLPTLWISGDSLHMRRYLRDVRLRN
jgi:hypothetical protein